jgi:hypothetical protein
MIFVAHQEDTSRDHLPEGPLLIAGPLSVMQAALTAVFVVVIALLPVQRGPIVGAEHRCSGVHLGLPSPSGELWGVTSCTVEVLSDAAEPAR